MNHVLDAFGDVLSFLEGDDLPPSKVEVQEILLMDQKMENLQMELAITIAAVKPFVKATID